MAAGIVLFLVTRSKDGPPPQAVVRIEAPDELCWVAELSIPPDQTGSLAEPVTYDGCGHDTFDLGTGAGGSAVVNKTSGPGLLAAVIVIDGAEVARQTTTAESESVTVVSPPE